ncbi:MAG: glycerol-3-phosphate dehydrogenase/oxidase [Anaerolineales bacterium]|jgi:glycerol-3-phosphate dehydrogenase
MWEKGWRDKVWSDLKQPFDFLIIGGGITGAGILREATRAGYRTLLVEADDFAAGTSSRSSKLVHGGFRYLKNAQIRITLESVHERERLLKEGRGLVSPLGFLLVNYQQDRQPPWIFGAGLMLYDLMALKWGHQHYDAEGMLDLCPQLNPNGLRGGYRFFDAQTDDARLVLRLLRESVRDGGAALNYAPAIHLLRSRQGEVKGAVIEDRVTPGAFRTAEVQAGVVINATGAWADGMRQRIGQRARLRKLRGSHLVFPARRLPLARAVSILHPRDQRYVFAFPWEGTTIVGTTDVDHAAGLEIDPAISSEEVAYLMEVVEQAFPEQALTTEDVQATFSGVRPVVDTGKADPSKESREHVLWCEDGLVTVTGGKLTTFRVMAVDALKSACARLSHNGERRSLLHKRHRVLNEPAGGEILRESLEGATRLRWLGRYGEEAPQVAAAARSGELERITTSPSRWAELRWAARQEAVVHLDDLLLRRVRLGLQLPHGGIDLLGKIQGIVQPELGWDDMRWEQEAQDYTRLWEKCYYLRKEGGSL